MSGLFVPHIEELTEITGEEYHHLTRSLRIKRGEKVWLTDGQGTLALAEVEHISSKSARVRILQRLERPGEPPAPIAIVASPLRQPQRIEWLVEKAVELGATALYFLPMERSIKKSVDINRLERVARAALKQNLRSVLPRLEFISSWEQIPWDLYTLRLMGEIGAPTTLKEALPPQPTSTLWIVGPEGDFTSQEIAYLKKWEAVGVSLGSLRLRAETAAIMLLGTLKALWGF
ncbi:MAG: 16S rRNA (uracil(1498)-N(3))-methyltransferase [Bacteroidia bacterium]|nr:16S rRNA (uracil(1498)-N(3))-methyltransferase [Bacteroidia bacterium]MCX7763488.1 16S rRNA (uracil(1498)-N(3))-methyltransferase [Bacteroidia bacterium]